MKFSGWPEDPGYFCQFLHRIHPKGIDVEEEHLVERIGRQFRFEQVLMEDYRFARFKMRFVPLPCGLDHRLRAVDGGDMAGSDAFADEADHVAVTTAYFENVFVWVDIEQIGRPSVALG